MKVLLLNGSPNEKGCTYRALQEVAATLEQQGMETELFYLGKQAHVPLPQTEPRCSPILSADANPSLAHRQPPLRGLSLFVSPSVPSGAPGREPDGFD